MATSSPCAAIASHLPTMIRVADSRLSRTRSRLLPARSPLTAARPRSGSTMPMTPAIVTQNQRTMSVATTRFDPGPRTLAAQAMRTNIAAWMPMNVQMKKPDCTPWRSSRTSIAGSQPGKSSPDQRHGLAGAAGRSRMTRGIDASAKAVSSGRPSRRLPRTRSPTMPSSRSQGRTTAASATQSTASPAWANVGAMLASRVGDDVAAAMAVRLHAAPRGKGSVANQPVVKSGHDVPNGFATFARMKDRKQVNCTSRPTISRRSSRAKRIANGSGQTTVATRRTAAASAGGSACDGRNRRTQPSQPARQVAKRIARKGMPVAQPGVNRAAASRPAAAKRRNGANSVATRLGMSTSVPMA